jgi:hypothetical protein
MRLSISGYEEDLKEFRKRTNISDSDAGSSHFQAFPNPEPK